MKILFPKDSMESHKKTRDWIKREGMKTFLNKLAAWVLAKEPQLGECNIFIECVLPPVTNYKLKNAQIDILIVFSNAIIICEMKGHEYFNKGVAKKYATQLNGEIDWLKSILRKNNNHRSIEICPLIFCPHMNLSRLAHAQKEIINEERFTHISITGMKEVLKMKNTYDKGIYKRAWIFDAIDEYISDKYRTDFNMPNFLFEMINDNTQLSEFVSFNKLYNYLLNYNRYSSINPNPKYVKRIRSKEEKKIMSSLDNNKIVEVYAPPGTGKTELIRHIASQIECPVLELQVKQAKNPSDILIQFIKKIYGYYDGVTSGDSLMKELTYKELFYWIQEYDESIFEVVTQFINELKDHYNRYGQLNNAYWVIESHKPILIGDNSFKLDPMDDNSILEILLQQKNKS
ncbi:hypothetical protein MHK_005818 [Candidatus Magnetomorum sp. HK-1]|nr:hypothetical protein MHK_005818 [Candidatus Magnetomorum sp. HK-1]